MFLELASIIDMNFKSSLELPVSANSAEYDGISLRQSLLLSLHGKSTYDFVYNALPMNDRVSKSEKKKKN